MTGVSAERRALLESGDAEAGTLAEALAIDHRVLLAAVLDDASPALRDAVERAQQLGILRRMTEIGAALHREVDADRLAELAAHPSDTARGWCCFAIAADASLGIEQLLERIRPFADDSAFTVREWAWMAARPVMVTDLDHSIDLLVPWTRRDSHRIRRFASESLRPRGVWAKQIGTLLQQPSLGEPILEPLRADPERYVQDSVGNWINDAAKSDPAWARAHCDRWERESPVPETVRIVARGLRSVGR